VSVDPTVLLIILLMGLVTYLCRIGGYWMMGRFTLSSRVEAGLQYLPGAVLISLVGPAMAEEGIPGVLAVIATAVGMRLTGNLLIAMLAGVLTIWLARQVG
jgi:uncharacterized membrane protein